MSIKLKMVVAMCLIVFCHGYSALFELMHMEDTEIELPITSTPEKAKVVFLTDQNKPTLFMYYTGTTLLGETSGPTFFVSEVEPGEQWIYMVPRVRDKVYDEIRATKFTFEKGKVYYFLFKFFMMDYTILAPLSPEEFAAEIKESELRALKFIEGKNEVPVVKEKWLEKARETYEEDVVEKQEYFQDILNYKGH